ncbi:ABC transporter permease subunit [Aliihoeflea aestuarii]|jgi:peptide/nickel transport system permease protein|uniref:ABC transporter permease n=1 Tax=Aliihoeflea aestuarii TaxID=453840 RepID=UPI002092D1A8|nr:ABC transporter permease [Aliihoeflea aestuarii]MCO6390110.1 ABC transporter permease subunit [Aliihoeflea aestuarii]
MVYLLRRLAFGVLLLAGVVILNFLLIRLAPGDPAAVIAGEMGGASQEVLASIRERYGLDKPLLVQLGIYLSNVVRGDLGESYFFNRPVIDLILSRLGPTILLVMAAQLLAIVLGVFMGVLASLKPQGFLSGFVAVISTVGYAAPVFWTGMMLTILFASIFPILPVEGMSSARFRGGTFDYILNVARHLILPATTLGIIFLAQYARLARAAMIDVLGADYVRTARAKGVPESRVVFKHALRNAVLPILTVAGLQFGNLISGALLVETVFNWPGMGRLAFDSILRRDYPVLLGVLFFSAMMVVLANILTDLSYRLADPRINTEGRS